MLIVFVGLPLAGKSTALDAARDMGFRTVQSGDIVREEIQRRGLEYNKETDREVAGWFHDGRERELIDRIIKSFGKADFEKDKLAIDGLRSSEQLDMLKEATGVTPYVISVIADFDERVERAIKRKRFKDESAEYVRQRDDVEKSRGLDGIMAKADWMIDTTGMDVSIVREKVRSHVSELLKHSDKH